MNKIHREFFLEVTTSSLALTNDQALSSWLNTKLSKFLLYEMMIYCWGDYNSTALNQALRRLLDSQQQQSINLS